MALCYLVDASDVGLAPLLVKEPDRPGLAGNLKVPQICLWNVMLTHFCY